MKISTVIEIYNCFTGILQFSSSHDMILLDNYILESVASMNQKPIHDGIDSLTGLMEMRHFLQTVNEIAVKDKEAGKYPCRCGIYFNISNFKLYNNIHGFENGDKCLVRIGEILRSLFEGDFICHQGADHFLVLAEGQRAIRRAGEACERVNAFLGNPGILLKAGINLLPEDPAPNSLRFLSIFFDKAKLACDSIKREMGQSLAYYSPEMGKYIKDQDFILENFDRALKDGSIKVCFQPVVRSITGKFCNSEALSRWEDPDYGSIRPDVFVKVLEEARLIHKLDTFVLRKVAEVQRYELDQGIPCVPVSVNFSRLDFFLMDPFEEVEKITKEFHLPRELIAIEITETALLKDRSVLSRAIGQFRDAGYEVWLDDFGTGYSSLNVLSDFRLNEIKLDIGFLRNFNEGKKRLISSIILMAKTLGLHTLAEGVETKEQADFLISIGCDKMQGYYYAKPMFLESAIDYPGQREIRVETPAEEFLFNRASAVNVITDKAMAFFLYDGARLSILYANPACLSLLDDMDYDGLSAANLSLSDPHIPLNEGIYALAKRARKERDGSFIYRDKGETMHIRLERLSEADGLTLFLAYLENLDVLASSLGLARYEEGLWALASLYNGIYYIHRDQGTLESVKTYRSGLAPGESLPLTEERLHDFAAGNIHPEDRARFLAFLKPESMVEAAEKSPRHAAVTRIRQKREDGAWQWVIYTAVPLRQAKVKDILLVIKDDTLMDPTEDEEFMKIYFDSIGSR